MIRPGSESDRLASDAGRAAKQYGCGEDHRSASVAVYTPESPLRRPINLFADMVRALASSRDLAWRLFMRDIRTRYRNSLLGYAWVIIPPLFSALPFIFLNAQGVIRIGETPLPYGAYALIGTMIWQVFSDALASPLQSMSGARAILTRINLPREAILLSGLMMVGFNFFVRLFLVALVLVVYGIVPPVTVILFPFGVIALIITGFAVGLILTPLGLLYGDVQRALGLITPVMMFMTPVLYPIPQQGLAASVAAINPLTPLVTSTRDWLTLGTTPDLFGFVVVTFSAILLLLAAWVAFRVALPHLIERFGM